MHHYSMSQTANSYHSTPRLRLRYTMPISLVTFSLLFYGYYEAWTH